MPANPHPSCGWRAGRGRVRRGRAGDHPSLHGTAATGTGRFDRQGHPGPVRSGAAGHSRRHAADARARRGVPGRSRPATSSMSRPASRKASATSSARIAASTRSPASAGSTQRAPPETDLEVRPERPVTSGPPEESANSAMTSGRWLHWAPRLQCGHDRLVGRSASAQSTALQIALGGDPCRPACRLHRRPGAHGAGPSDTDAGPAVDPARLRHRRRSSTAGSGRSTVIVEPKGEPTDVVIEWGTGTETGPVRSTSIPMAEGVVDTGRISTQTTDLPIDGGYCLRFTATNSFGSASTPARCLPASRSAHRLPEHPRVRADPRQGLTRLSIVMLVST